MRRRCLKALSLVLLAWGLSAPTRSSASPSTYRAARIAHGSHGTVHAALVTHRSRLATHRSHRSHRSHIITLSLASPALGDTTYVRVLLPDGYGLGERRYPVLYLLHGYTDSYLSWSTKGDVAGIAGRLPLIVVMPDGDNGWYTNPLTGGGPRWEDYHIGELIPYVDSHFRTVRGRAGRAIAGVSMGGLGALTYAARHPDLFVAAASFSGVLDLDALKQYDVFFPTLSAFGDPRAAAWDWSDHNPTELAPNLHGLRLYIAAGDGRPGPFDALTGFTDPAEYYTHLALLHMAAALRRAGVAATVDDYGRGTHSWPYWQRDLRRALAAIMAAFAHPPPAPVPWSYRTRDHRFALWGYTMRVAAPGHEWTALRGVSRAGFSATGRGLLTITTAPLYRSRAGYTITSAGGVAPATGARRVIKAGRDGRLRLQLILAGAARRRLTITPTHPGL